MKPTVKYILFVLVIMILPACEDMLTKFPSDKPSNVNFFSNQDELIAAINGTYTVFWDLESRNIPLGAELDNATDIGFLRSGNLKQVAQGGHSSTNALIVAVWDRLYAGIGKANNLLDNMSRAEENVSEEFYARIQGEARFIRAYCYHYLVGLYGDVPLITEIPTYEEADVGRSPKAEVVTQILKDLDFAAQVLPASWSGDDEGRATKGAALALKARVALYNEMFDLAATTAKEVMDLGEYMLYPDYEALFQYDGVNSPGVIFSIPYEIGIHDHNIPFRMGTRNAGAVSTDVPSQFMVDSYICTDGKPIDESSVYDPDHPFENRDPRLDASVVRPGTTFLGYVFYTHPDSTETWKIEGKDSTRVKNLDVTNPYATFTGYIWRKYLAEEDFPENQTTSSLNWIYIRYAEVLLTYAEAKIENGSIDQSVLDAINTVRARGFGVEFSAMDQYPAITTTNQVELRRIVRNERKVELAHEGFRLFDLRRWEIAEEAMDGYLIGRPIGAYATIPAPPEINDVTGHPEYGSRQDLYRNVEPRFFDPGKHYLWPIPQNALDVNENLTQNPGY